MTLKTTSQNNVFYRLTFTGIQFKLSPQISIRRI